MNLSKFSASIGALLLLANCSSFGKIKVTKDDFKDATVVTLKLKHEGSEDTGVLSPSNKAEVTYTKELKNSGENKFLIKFRVYGPSIKEGIGISEKAFLKVDGKKEDFSFSSSQVQAKTTVKSSSKRNTSGTGTQSEVETETSTVYFAIAKADLPFSLVNKIGNAKLVVFRVYAESQPITLKLEPDDLKKLKKFAAAK